MLQTAKTFDEVYQNILQLNKELPLYGKLARRLAHAHVWYVVKNPLGKNCYGFSKYCGYSKVNAEVYLAAYRSLNGRSTEKTLRTWFQEVPLYSKSYQIYHKELSELLDGYDKAPRSGVRFCVPKDDWVRLGAGPKNNVLALLVAVANTLTPQERAVLKTHI